MEKKVSRNKTMPKKKKTKPTTPDNLIGIKFVGPLDLNQRGGSSVEIKRNAKGDTEFRVKVYDDEIVIARKLAIESFEILTKKYKKK